MTDKPDVRSVWAETGEKTHPGFQKVSDGWVAEIPTYQNFNWLQHRQSAFQAHVNERGIPAWDGLTVYLDGALVIHLGEVWRSTEASNSGNEPGTGQGWTIFSDYVLQSLDLSINTGDGLTGNGQVTAPIELSVGGLPTYTSDLAASEFLVIFDASTNSHYKLDFASFKQQLSEGEAGNSTAELLGGLQSDPNSSNPQSYSMEFDVRAGQKVLWDAVFSGEPRVVQNIAGANDNCSVQLLMDGVQVANASSSIINFGDGAFSGENMRLAIIGEHEFTSNTTVEFVLNVTPAATKEVAGRTLFCLYL